MRLIFKVFVILLFLLSVPLVAQTDSPKITYGPVFKDSKKKTEQIYSLPTEDDGLVVLRGYYGGLDGKAALGYYLEYYNKELQLVNKKQFKINYSKIKSLFVLNGEVNILEYRRNLREGRHEYFLLKADLDSFEFNERLIYHFPFELVRPFGTEKSTKSKANSAIYSFDLDPEGEVKISNNSKYLTILLDIKEGDYEHYKMVTYDSDFNQIFQRDIKLNDKDAFFKLKSIKVNDKDGSVYLLGHLYMDGSYRMFRSDTVNVSHKILKIGEFDLKEQLLYSSSNIDHSLKMNMIKNKILITGTYSDEVDSDIFNLNTKLIGRDEIGNSKGLVTYSLDATNLEIDGHEYSIFELDFLREKYGEKKAQSVSNKGKGVGVLKFEEPIIDLQGNIYLIAEELVLGGVKGISDPGLDYDINFDYKIDSTVNLPDAYDDVYIFKINAKGKIEWSRVINKKQSTKKNPEYLSYSIASVNGKAYILINGADEVKKLKDERIEFRDIRSSKLNLYLITIDEMGEMSYQIIVPNDSSKMAFKTKFGLNSFNNSSIIMEGNYKKQKRIIRIDFTEVQNN